MQLFVDDLAIDVDVGSPFELDPHDRDADARGRADAQHVRGAVQHRFDRERDQRLDFFGREARRFGHDRDRGPIEIRKHIDRQLRGHVAAVDQQHDGGGQHQRAILQRKGDDVIQHFDTAANASWGLTSAAIAAVVRAAIARPLLKFVMDDPPGRDGVAHLAGRRPWLSGWLAQAVIASRASIPSFSSPEGLSSSTHTLIARPQAESVGAVRLITPVAENMRIGRDRDGHGLADAHVGRVLLVNVAAHDDARRVVDLEQLVLRPHDLADRQIEERDSPVDRCADLAGGADGLASRRCR